jgi:hypothetical protein
VRETANVSRTYNVQNANRSSQCNTVIGILQLKSRQGVQHTSLSQHHVNEEELEVKLS